MGSNALILIIRDLLRDVPEGKQDRSAAGTHRARREPTGHGAKRRICMPCTTPARRFCPFLSAERLITIPLGTVSRLTRVAGHPRS